LFYGINIIQLFVPFGTNIIRNKYTVTAAATGINSVKFL